MHPSQTDPYDNLSISAVKQKHKLSKKASKMSITAESIIPDGLLDRQEPISSLTAENVENAEAGFISEQPSLYEESIEPDNQQIKKIKSTGVLNT